MSLRSPLRRVLGLGASGTGTEHWLAQRLSAVALVPLTLWFVISLLTLPTLDFYIVNAWAAAPLHSILLALLVVALVYHSHLGAQMVAEDYVQMAGLRVAVLILLRLLHVALGVAGILAVFLIATRASL
ncbi:MAG: succinate dehydrogenase, hydrophobic membrane anchor protein [Gammaproteobacteria bacterium]|nr:succinate dehydrogenase, hydrophobic membrane anchor protein [Gammaproteobacteria bacterium]